LVIGRMTRGIDLREYGSHRTGATNALRTLGARSAALVLVLDVAKGVAAVLLARLIFADDPQVEWTAAVAGFAAIVGHNWSVFIGFTGGRGVATSSGALGAMSIWTVVIVVPIVPVRRARIALQSSVAARCCIRARDEHRQEP
jgi:glycerol-3-phosphate acyltransferase PlsY